MAENEKTVCWEIKEHLATLRENTSGWKRELNIVSWNEGPAKIDIRDWSEDHLRMTRGITLTTDEARTVRDAVSRYLEKAQERETRAARETGYER